MLAALNHPNIAAIYGLEEIEGTSALVLELVEGETLSERIARSPIEPREAIALTTQIAEALEAAHASSIIHRDLKPGNVMVTPEGKVKVLDFGLAKALEGEVDTGVDATASPTLSLAATQAGMILGTAGYMSPEQARGQVVDQRADIWALGVILYEMLAGRRAFAADTVPDTLARVLTQEPAWERLDSLPRPVHRLLRRCLNKDAERRYRDVGDVRLEMEDLLADWDRVNAAETTSLSPAAATSSHGVSAPLVAAIAVLALAIGAGATWLVRGSSQPVTYAPPRTTFDITYPVGYRLPGFTHPLAFSPDGRHLVHLMIQGQQRYLQVRPLDRLEGREIGDASEGEDSPSSRRMVATWAISPATTR